jgi:hypothetical protein
MSDQELEDLLNDDFEDILDEPIDDNFQFDEICNTMTPP